RQLWLGTSLEFLSQIVGKEADKFSEDLKLIRGSPPSTPTQDFENRGPGLKRQLSNKGRIVRTRARHHAIAEKRWETMTPIHRIEIMEPESRPTLRLAENAETRNAIEVIRDSLPDAA